MTFSFNKEIPASNNRSADQSVIRYLDPKTNQPKVAEWDQPLPQRMRFAPIPRPADDRD